MIFDIAYFKNNENDFNEKNEWKLFWLIANAGVVWRKFF